jgi:hypothetical protein
MARPLYRERQNALVFGTGAGATSGLDLPAIGNIALERRCILVVDRIYMVDAEGTYLPLGDELAGFSSYIPSPPGFRWLAWFPSRQL